MPDLPTFEWDGTHTHTHLGCSKYQRSRIDRNICITTYTVLMYFIRTL